jgi:hypothetical protein
MDIILTLFLSVLWNIHINNNIYQFEVLEPIDINLSNKTIKITIDEIYSDSFEPHYRRN